MLNDATVERDEAESLDVLLRARFSESELDLMLGLLEIVGEGIQ